MGRIPCQRWCGRTFDCEVNRDRHMRVQEGRCWDEYQVRLAANLGHIEIQPPVPYALPQDNHANRPPRINLAHQELQAQVEPMDWDGPQMGLGNGGQAGGEGERAEGEGGREGERERVGEDEIGDPWLKRLKTLFPGKHVVIVQDAAEILEGRSPTLMDRFSSDRFAEERKQVPYYPFRDREEWQLAEFLSNSTLSMRAIDEFLKLELVSGYNPQVNCCP